MEAGNWIPIDKRLAQFLPIKRPYTELEAMFSYSKDMDENKEKAVREYARIWQWSRTKVDNYMQKIKASKEPEESQKKASKEPEESQKKASKEPEFRFVFNSLRAIKSQKKASKEPEESQKKASTINPNPNPLEKTSSSADEVHEIITKKKKKLTGKRLETFLQFWEAFDYKKGKADAADAWLDIPQMTLALVNEIVLVAKKEASLRPALIEEGKTPKMAQGWLTGRRWEDKSQTITKKIPEEYSLPQESEAIKEARRKVLDKHDY